MSAPKLVILGVWLLCVVAFLGGGDGWFLALCRRVFWLMLVVHGVECVLFRDRLRRASGSLPGHLAQTLLFGLFHLRELPRAA